MDQIAHNRSERGATLVSTLMLVVAMSTVALLGMRNSMREITQSGSLVAQERALMSAQAAIDLAAVQYRDATDAMISGALAGSGTRDCSDPCGDCVPGDADTGGTEVGQRNHILSQGAPVDCNGLPCMRQGAVVNVAPTATGTAMAWCNTPVRDLLSAGDPEATVTVWIRNNASDAFGDGTWVQDTDSRFVLTASATVRGATVSVEQEIMVKSDSNDNVWGMPSPDGGYGSGHNNDNASVSLCKDNAIGTGD